MCRIGLLFGLQTAAVLAGATIARGQAPSFTFVGASPGAAGSWAFGLSATGQVATGYSNVPGFGRQGFIWTAAQGRVDFVPSLGFPGPTEALGISGDGFTVVGDASLITGIGAYRWRGAGTYEPLGVLPGYAWSFGEGVSGDGSVVVGRSQSADSAPSGQAFRWTPSGGMHGLGYTPGRAYSDAVAISRDGGTVVGFASDLVSSRGDAFAWTVLGGMQVLPQLPGSPPLASAAYGANFDGSIVVGLSAFFPRPVMWVEGQIMDLGLPAGWTSGVARAVNDDGAVVVGGIGGNGSAAGVWTSGRGPELLIDYLAANGVQMPLGTFLRDSYAVSADGLTIAGVGGIAGQPGLQGFVASVPTPATGIVLFGALGFGLRRSRDRSNPPAISDKAP